MSYTTRDDQQAAGLGATPLEFQRAIQPAGPGAALMRLGGRFPGSAGPARQLLTSSALVELAQRRRRGAAYVVSGGELAGCGVCVDDGLGFSLKPPKWLRKAQPGKLLKKAAPYLAAAGALAIPGVAPALLAAGKVVGGAALSAGRFAGRFGKVAAAAAARRATAAAPAVLSQHVAETVARSMPPPPPPVITALPAPMPSGGQQFTASQPAAEMIARGGVEAETSGDASAATGGGMSPLLLVAGAAALLFVMRKK